MKSAQMGSSLDKRDPSEYKSLLTKELHEAKQGQGQRNNPVHRHASPESQLPKTLGDQKGQRKRTSSIYKPAAPKPDSPNTFTILQYCTPHNAGPKNGPG